MKSQLEMNLPRLARKIALEMQNFPVVNHRLLEKLRHSDGNLWALLDLLVATGYDGLNPLEPQADMDLKKVKAHCGDKICLLGNIDCLELLPAGTPAQVDAAVKQAIEDAAAGGGYIVCSSNSLHPAVNPENRIAMFEDNKKYGRYEES